MKAFALAALLLLSLCAAFAAAPEEAYLAARDRDIESLKTLEATKDTAASDARNETALKALEGMLQAIVGPLAIDGFPAEGTINVGSLSSRDEGYGTLDGLVHGTGPKSVVVTTDGLFDKWLIGHRDWGSKDTLPPTAAEAVTTGTFYTQAVQTDAAIVALADIPVAIPPGATFAHAILSGRSQFATPNAPDEIFVALEHEGRVFIVNEKLTTPFGPIAACDAVMARYATKAEAADKKAARARDRATRTLMDQADQFRADGDTAFRACFRTKVKNAPAFDAAKVQAEGILLAFTR